MTSPFIVKATLLASGLVASAVGGGILLAPHAFHASAGIHIAEDVNLINEMRAAGGAQSNPFAIVRQLRRTKHHRIIDKYGIKSMGGVFKDKHRSHCWAVRFSIRGPGPFKAGFQRPLLRMIINNAARGQFAAWTSLALQ